MEAEADFSGYATKANLKCSDGRTIAPDAFKHQDKLTVPLVWAHTHNQPENVLGHAVLENREDGVYCKAYFNDTEKGRSSKILVQHGDITQLSIYANRLVERSKTVIHGMIREVSLVLAGANPGAQIDFVNFAHSDGSIEVLEDEAVIYTGLSLEHGEEDDNSEENSEDENSEEENDEEVSHADEERSVQDVLDTFNEEQKNVVYYMLGKALKGNSAEHSDNSDENLEHSSEDVKNVYEAFSDEQRDVVHFMIGEALSHAQTEAANADDQEGNQMKHNVFENGAGESAEKATLSHDDVAKIFKSAQRGGTLKQAFEAYVENSDTLQHGIQNIDVLFPDAKSVTNTPDWVKRRTEWVSEVLGSTKHTPFSRIKSMTANLTFAEARAKGYIKGTFKEEEFFPVARRVTTPQTIYKKQQLDRDDILDITDFDVVAWLKGEMRIMLDEEIARAVLIGDGRSAGDNDKIKEENIRPIATDNDLYVTKVNVNLGDAQSSVEEVIDAIILNRRFYRGSGNPTFFCGEVLLSQFLSLKDSLGRRLYQSTNDLLPLLRCSKIVTVEVMDEPTSPVLAIMVNLSDYTIGTDKGGDVTLFDDFDIDYNQNKYLIETRISGALVKAKSALVVVKTLAAAVKVVPVAPAWNNGTKQVTVSASPTGITYKNKATGATLVNGTPITLAAGQELVVIAVPTSSSYYLDNDAADEFRFTYADGQLDQPF